MPADTRSGLTNDYSGPLSLNASRMGDPTPYVLCDIRLNRLTISEWTDVPISSEIAGYAISRYLELDHPILSFFDANIFLADLANHTEIVCSGFLVNSLLSWACVSFYYPAVTHHEYGRIELLTRSISLTPESPIYHPMACKRLSIRRRWYNTTLAMVETPLARWLLFSC